jgi:hypothetical protein
MVSVQLKDAEVSKQHLEEQLSHAESKAQSTEQLVLELTQQKDQLKAQGVWLPGADAAALPLVLSLTLASLAWFTPNQNRLSTPV